MQEWSDLLLIKLQTWKSEQTKKMKDRIFFEKDLLLRKSSLVLQALNKMTNAAAAGKKTSSSFFFKLPPLNSTFRSGSIAGSTFSLCVFAA